MVTHCGSRAHFAPIPPLHGPHQKGVIDFHGRPVGPSAAEGGVEGGEEGEDAVAAEAAEPGEQRGHLVEGDVRGGHRVVAGGGPTPPAGGVVLGAAHRPGALGRRHHGHPGRRHEDAPPQACRVGAAGGGPGGSGGLGGGGEPVGVRLGPVPCHVGIRLRGRHERGPQQERGGVGHTKEDRSKKGGGAWATRERSA